MILVFKTSVSTFLEVESLKPQLDKQFPNAKWNFDLEDCDNIFRVEGQDICSLTIVELFLKFKFNCEELF
jgi:hypothetical protein